MLGCIDCIRRTFLYMWRIESDGICNHGRYRLYYWNGRNNGDDVKPIEVSMPPALFRNADGICYAIAGSAWVEVPPETTFDDLPKYMTYKPREIKRPAGEKVWKVEGSKGNIYTVKLSDGAYSCTCPGFGFRRKCRHIEEIKNGK